MSLKLRRCERGAAKAGRTEKRAPRGRAKQKGAWSQSFYYLGKETTNLFSSLFLPHIDRSSSHGPPHLWLPRAAHSPVRAPAYTHKDAHFRGRVQTQSRLCQRIAQASPRPRAALLVHELRGSLWPLGRLVLEAVLQTGPSSWDSLFHSELPHSLRLNVTLPAHALAPEPNEDSFGCILFLFALGQDSNFSSSYRSTWLSVGRHINRRSMAATVFRHLLFFVIFLLHFILVACYGNCGRYVCIITFRAFFRLV